VLLMTIVGFVLYGSMVMLPIFLQQLLGYPAVQAGIAMFPRGLGSFIMMPLTGMLLSKFDGRKLLAIGVVGAAYSMWMLSTINLNAGYWNIFWPQFLQGVSLSLLFVPLTTVTMAAISREMMGTATSMFNLLRNLGGSVGIAFATTYLSRREQVHHAVLASHVNALDPVAQNTIASMTAAMQAGGTDATLATQRAYGAIQGMVQRQASMLSFLDTFRFMAIVFVLVLPLLLLLRRARGKSETPAH